MFSALISIFLLMFVGYAVRRAGALRMSDAGAVRTLVTNFTGPAFIFVAIYGKSINRDMMVAPIVHVVSLVITVAAAYAFARVLKLDRPTTGALMLASAFGNTGFLGYPVVDAAYPGDHMAKAAVVMVDQLGETISMYSIGIAIAVAFGSHARNGYNALGFVKTPLFLSMVLVFALRLPILNAIHIPQFILSPEPAHTKGVINYLSACTVPIAMIGLWLLIRRQSAKVLAAPFAIACVSTLLVMVLNLPAANAVHIPSFLIAPEPMQLKGILNYFAGATIPFAMISLGLSITRVPMHKMLLPFAAACVLKFVAMPLLNLVGLHLVGIHGTVREIAMLEAAMPAAIMTSVISGRYGSNAAFSSAAVFLMTLMSIAIIPLALSLIR